MKEREMNWLTITYYSWPPWSKDSGAVSADNALFPWQKSEKSSWEPLLDTLFYQNYIQERDDLQLLKLHVIVCYELFLRPKGFCFHILQQFWRNWNLQFASDHIYDFFLEKNLLSGFQTSFSVHYQKLMWQQLGLNPGPSAYEPRTLPLDQSWTCPDWELNLSF